VQDLGFDRLQSHTDFCMTQSNGEQNCIMDASYTILRMRLPNDSIKEIKIYGDFANDLQAFQGIRDLLTGYAHPDAQPYIPERGALFISESAGEAPSAAIEWPLAPSLLLHPKNDQGLWAVSLGDQEINRYLEVSGRNAGDTLFKYEVRFTAFTLCHGCQVPITARNY